MLTMIMLTCWCLVGMSTMSIVFIKSVVQQLIFDLMMKCGGITKVMEIQHM